MKKISLILISILMLASMAACGGNSTENTNNADNTGNAGAAQNNGSEMSVILDIDFPDNSNVADVDDMTITVPADSSVLDVLNTYAEANNAEILLDESSESPYITSINGVAQSDTAGWTYEVNDEMVMESAGTAIVKNGDEISFDFETWNDMDD